MSETELSPAQRQIITAARRVDPVAARLFAELVGGDRYAEPEGVEMTPDEFKRRVQEIIDGKHPRQRRMPWSSDAEVGHARYDDLLEEVLRSLGYGDGIDLVAKMTRWSA